MGRMGEGLWLCDQAEKAEIVLPENRGDQGWLSSSVQNNDIMISLPEVLQTRGHRFKPISKRSKEGMWKNLHLLSSYNLGPA